MILVLGKLGLKLCFWNTFHHILMHFVHQCFEVFLHCVFVLFKNCVFFFLSKNFVSLCLLRLIQSAFRSIKIVLKFLKKPLSVSINRNWFSINRKSWIRFFKIRVWLVQTYFSKSFSNFSLSLNWTRLTNKVFCRFPPDFLQGFPLYKLVCPFCPSFCILFHVFMHSSMHFIGYFQNFSNWDFCWFKLLFLKLIIGFCFYNVIIMIYDN